MEVINHDLALESDCVVVAFHIASQFLLGPFLVKFGIRIDRLGQSVIALYRGVLLQNIEDEPLLDGLFHRVRMERLMTRLTVFFVWLSENFESLVLWSGSEGKIACVRQHLL